MRLENELIAQDVAPAERISFMARFDQVNGSVEVAGPSRGLDLALCFVDQDQSSRLNHRMHAPVIRSDLSIATSPRIYTVQQHHRKLAPPLHKAAEKGGLTKVQPRVKRQWNHDRADGLAAKTHGVCPAHL